MKKRFSRFLGIVMSLLLLCGVFPAASAAGGKTAFIVVSGMGSFPLYDESGASVFPPESDAITKMVFELIPPTAAYLIDRDADKLCDKLLPPLAAVFGKAACDENGNSVYEIGTPLFDGSLADKLDQFAGETTDEAGIVNAGIARYGVENTFFFNYDWRLSPLEHADRLAALIRYVKETTGCTRIALAAFSMGGTVTLSYLYKYGSADIDSLSLCSTAFQGTSSVGDLFSGKVGMSMEGLMRRLAQLTRNDFAENLLYYVNEQLNLFGINRSLSDFANGLVLDTQARVYPEFILPVFGQLPGFWAICDIDSYETARDFMLDPVKHAGLIALTDEYYYNVQCKARELLEAASADTNVYVIAQYNMQGLPVSETSNTSNNDYLIDVCYASGGVVAAPLGDKLPETYTQAAHPEKDYISPDRQIDASTCMFPDRTWFIRDMGHVDYPIGDATDLILTFADSEEQLTVDSLARFPQFMGYSYRTNTLSPVKADPEKSFAEKFFGALIRLLQKLEAFTESFRKVC